MKNLNLFQFSQGGIYCIRCLKNKRNYIGSSASFLERAARHWTPLKSKNHALLQCLALQKDFNKYGSKFFEFKILIFETNSKKRLQLEKQIIKQQTKVYNDLTSCGFQKNKPLLGQQILINKKIYPSIRGPKDLQPKGLQIFQKQLLCVD